MPAVKSVLGLVKSAGEEGEEGRKSILQLVLRMRVRPGQTWLGEER